MDIKNFIFIYSPAVVTFIGAIIAAIGAFNKTKQAKRIVLIGAVIVAVGSFWSAIQSNKFKAELKMQNYYILSTITGGENFCRLSLVSINSITNNALMIAIPVREYPLYEVNFRIIDLAKFEKLPEDVTFEDFSRTQININVGNLSPGVCKVLDKLNLGTGNEKKYNVFMSARNGHFIQLIRLKRIEGNWVMATKIMKGDKKLWERIDDKYPKNEEGEIDW